MNAPEKLSAPDEPTPELDRSGLEQLVRKNGTLEKEEWLEDGIAITARIPGSFDSEGNPSSRTLALLAPYLVK